MTCNNMWSCHNTRTFSLPTALVNVNMGANGKINTRLSPHVDGPDGRAVRCHLAVLAKGWRDRTVGRRRRSGDSSRVSKGRIERREETHAHSWFVHAFGWRTADFATDGWRPSIRMCFVVDWGGVGAILFRWELISSLSAHACKILAQSDGRLERSTFQIDK